MTASPNDPAAGANKRSRTLRFDDGATQFRLRLAASVLSSRPLLIRNVRFDDIDAPGLREHEASFLRLLDRMTNGTKIEINATGTQLRFKPGVLLGGTVEHDCPVGAEGARGVGWFLEGILPLAAFGKEPLDLTLRGVTDGTADVDPSPDYLQSSCVPVMIRAGIGADGDESPPSIRVTRRGAAPAGGGTVVFHCPIVRELRPVEMVDFGLVKRVRGSAVSCRIPPSSAARVAHSAKGVMHRLLPDVWVHTDVHSSGTGGRKRGRAGDEAGGCGPSPGLSVMLTATTTEGVCLAAECSMRHGGTTSLGDGGVERAKMELPEELGRRAATMLLHEVHAGGCVDTNCQALALMLMCLTPEDVSRIRLGPLSRYSIVALRLFKEAFGTEFKLRVEQDVATATGDDDSDSDGEAGKYRGERTVICSCLGIGYRNMARAST